MGLSGTSNLPESKCGLYSQFLHGVISVAAWVCSQYDHKFATNGGTDVYIGSFGSGTLVEACGIFCCETWLRLNVFMCSPNYHTEM